MIWNAFFKKVIQWMTVQGTGVRALGSNPLDEFCEISISSAPSIKDGAEILLRG
jgi:hypothetical protein